MSKDNPATRKITVGIGNRKRGSEQPWSHPLLQVRHFAIFCQKRQRAMNRMKELACCPFFVQKPDWAMGSPGFGWNRTNRVPA
jgi:hypothetical protein